MLENNNAKGGENSGELLGIHPTETEMLLAEV